MSEMINEPENFDAFGTFSTEEIKQLTADPDRLPYPGQYHFRVVADSLKVFAPTTDKPGVLAVRLKVVNGPAGNPEPEMGWPTPALRLAVVTAAACDEKQRNRVRMGNRDFASLLSAVGIEFDGRANKVELLQSCYDAEFLASVEFGSFVTSGGETRTTQNIRNFRPLAG